MIAARPAAVDYRPLHTAQVHPLPVRQAATVRKLHPQSNTLPLWLRQLVALQRGSTVAAVIMGSLTLLAYSWTVHSQRSWSQAYSQLAALRRDEPQLTRANEVLKEHLAQQAESLQSGLIEPNPAHMLYLEPADPRPAREVPAAPPTAQDETPLGY